MPPVIVTSTTYNGNHERFELSRYTIPTLSTEVTSIQQLRIQWDTWDHCEPLNSTCDLFAKRLEANDVPVTIPCSESGLLAVNPRSVMDTESFYISYFIHRIFKIASSSYFKEDCKVNSRQGHNYQSYPLECNTIFLTF